MPSECGTIELERVENFAYMLDQGVDRVLLRYQWLVGETVSFEINCNRAKVTIRRKSPPTSVRFGAAASGTSATSPTP